jgi:DNA uptake protein ComE-like DNA-binding protein
MRGKLLVAALFFALAAQAQIDPVQQAIEYLVEFGQTESEEPDLVQVAEQLSYLQNNPIPVNSATADELLEIPLLNSFLVFNLLEYRNRSGRLLSFYQMADVKGFTPRLIKLLQPFITLEEKRETRLFPTRFRHQLAVRYRQVVQRADGFVNGTYPGHRSENYLRYRLQGQGKLFAGLTAQRDPGEPALPNGYSPDFTSLHVEFRGNKTVKNVVLGDFSAEYGQGLTLWSSLAFNKSAQAVTITRFGRGIRHYTGTDENRFLRGGGTTLKLGDFQVAAFYSNNRVAANLLVDENGRTVATSLQQSGFHRTVNEQADKRSQQLQITGAHVEWRPQRLRLGLLTTHTKMAFPLIPADQIQNTQRFRGDELLHTALDWKWLYGRMFFFGEASYEWLNQRTALSAGLQVQAADGLQWVLQYRNLQAGWFSAYNAPFSETGRDGEQGVYLGLNWQLPANLSLAMFADLFQYNWLRSNLNRPGSGADYMAQLNYQPLGFNSYFRFRYQVRPRTISSDLTIREAADARRLTLRWHGNIPVSEAFILQVRAEWVQFQHDLRTDNGLLTYAGFSWTINAKWRLKARYALFDTDSYDAAIWAYEDDVPYSYTVPAFFNTGSKWYAVVTYKMTKNIELWFRLADAYLPYETTLGSGADQLQTNRRTEFKVLARFTF